MSIEFNNTEQKLTNQEILEFQSLFSKKIPLSFIEHYLKYNGGFPTSYYVEGVKEIFSIDGFLPIKYGSYTIEEMLNDYKIDFSLRLPFANDSGGNIFYISLNDDNYGNIYLYETGIKDVNNKILVTLNFNDFILNLMEDEI